MFIDFEQLHSAGLVKAFITNICRVPNGAFDVHVQSCNDRHVPLFTRTLGVPFVTFIRVLMSAALSTTVHFFVTCFM